MAEETWITEKGECIKVGDMSEKHLKNTLRMLVRQMRNRRRECLEWHIEQQLRLAKGEPLLNSLEMKNEKLLNWTDWNS
jgi:hypothetical protein